MATTSYRDRLRGMAHSVAAYTLVDLSDLDEGLRKEILQDASEGGGAFGIRVVEESVNGAARFPIFGVYKEGPDAERWANAKKELGISGSEVDDSTIYTGAGIEVTDPRKEGLLREAAAQAAGAIADRIRAGENLEVSAITGDEDASNAVGQPTGGDHPINIVDPGLAGDATNKASDAEASQAATDESKKSANKAPK